MTVYALHALTGILGPARRVTALSGVRVHERAFAGRVVPTEADDNTVLLLDFGESLFAVVYGVAAGSVNDEFSAIYLGTDGARRLGQRGPAVDRHRRAARHVIEIIEAAYRSAETGEAQELRTILEPEPAREPNPGRSDGGNDA